MGLATTLQLDYSTEFINCLYPMHSISFYIEMIKFNHLIATDTITVCINLCCCCSSPGLSMFNAA